MKTKTVTARSSHVARGLALLCAIGLLLLAAAGCGAPRTAPPAASVTVPTGPGPTAGARPSQAFLLYLQRGFQPELAPIDPTTLADLPDHPHLKIPGVEQGPAHYSETTFTASADGSTVAAFTGGLTGYVRILDARTHTLRAQFPAPEGTANIQSIAPDGSRLAMPSVSGPPPKPEWHVLSAADGRQLASIPACCQLFDWSRGRGYVVTWRGNEIPGNFVPPRTPMLLAYDIASGRQVGQLVLDGLLAGSVEIKRVNDNRVETSGFGPSPGLSPDGRRIVLLHGNEDKLTIVDAQALKILSTRELRSPHNQLRPGAAIRGWSLQFSPEGLLYASGSEERLVVAGDAPPVRWMGVRLIDIDQATILAETLVGEDWAWTLVAPDGKAVYFFGGRHSQATATPGSGDIPGVLRRLDPHSLAVTAERELPGVSFGYMLAAPAQHTAGAAARGRVPRIVRPCLRRTVQLRAGDSPAARDGRLRYRGRAGGVIYSAKPAGMPRRQAMNGIGTQDLPQRVIERGFGISPRVQAHSSREALLNLRCHSDGVPQRPGQGAAAADAGLDWLTANLQAA